MEREIREERKIKPQPWGVQGLGQHLNIEGHPFCRQVSLLWGWFLHFLCKQVIMHSPFSWKCVGVLPGIWLVPIPPCWPCPFLGPIPVLAVLCSVQTPWSKTGKLIPREMEYLCMAPSPARSCSNLPFSTIIIGFWDIAMLQLLVAQASTPTHFILVFSKCAVFPFGIWLAFADSFAVTDQQKQVRFLRKGERQVKLKITPVWAMKTFHLPSLNAFLRC